MTTRKHIRLSALSFVLVLCGSLLVSCMSPVFSTIVSADAASRFGDENNKHYSAIALRDCLAQLGSRKTSISSDVMFGSGTPGAPGPHVAIGRWLEPDDGDFDCSDESTTSRAAGFLGFASVGDYLKGIGYSVRVVHIPKQCSGYNPQVCRDPHDATTYTINGNDKAGQLVGKYGQSDIAVYFMHLVVFQRGCQINVPPQAGDKTVTMKQITNQGGSFVTKDVPAGFSFKQQGVNNNPTSGGGGGTGNGTITQVDTQNQLIVKFDYNDVSKTCGHILDTMNSMAGAVAAWDNQHKDEAITTDVINKGTAGITDKAGSLPSCQGGSLGWLICPLTEMFSSIISAIAKYIDGLLFFKPLIIGDTASGDAIYSLWRVVIVPANLLLVVAFLVVIFSQATSFGLSSYGIKKMLPRIIAAAILINLSYFLCAVAVDITNVIGAGVKGMMEGVPLPNGTSLRGSTWVDWLATGVVGSLVTGTTVVTGAVFYIVPMLAAAVIAVLTAFLVVAARQVLITLMIIIAPLAFAALVLPNTNELFTKWRKAFAALLFMYPLIMLVFYGSMVVSKIVAVTAQQGTDPSINLIQQVLVLCILIFPLFSLPIIMKAAGGLLQRFGLWANDKSKGLIDRSNKWAKGRQARSTFSQMMNARKDAGDANASQRAARRMGTGFGQFASTVGMNKNTKGIMQAQIGDANDKLHAQQVTYEKRNVRSRYNASDRRDREQMAKDAADAAQRGDSVAYDAIMSHAADAGADEFSHTFTQTQKELHRRDPDSLKAGTKAHKTLSDGHKFIAATHGDKLSEKNRALGEVLRQADPTANIKAAMHNDAGARAYYGKAKPEAAANFSSDTARAAAEFLDDHVLEQLLTNSELMKTVSPSARDAYQAEYAGRKSGAFSRTGEGDVSRAASAVGSDANYFDY